MNAPAVPVLPVPTDPINLFIVRHGRRMGAFFLSLVSVLLVGVASMLIIARVPDAITNERIANLAQHTITAVGALASLFIIGNTSSDFAKRGTTEASVSSSTVVRTETRQSGAIPAEGTV